MIQSKNILILQRVLIALMLLYPICAFHRLPLLGDGERYYLRLLLPIAVMTIGLKAWGRELKLRNFLPLGAAVLPWILVVAVLMVVHQKGGFSSYLVLPLAAGLIFAATDDIRYPEKTLYMLSSFFCILIATLQGMDVFYGTFSHWAEGDRGGLGGNPVPFAHTCTFFVGVVFIGLMKSLEKKEKIHYIVFYAISCLFGLVLIYLTRTRGAQLSIAILLILMIFKNIRGNNRLVLSLLGVALIVFLGYAYQRFMIGFNEIAACAGQLKCHTSWGVRLELWTIAWEGFLDKPFLGWGPDPLPSIISAHPEVLKWYKWAKDADFHSDYFNLLATGGAILVISYMAMMSAFAWIARKNIGALWAVLNLLVLGISNTAFRGRAVAVSFFLVYLLFLRCEGNNQEYEKNKQNSG